MKHRLHILLSLLLLTSITPSIADLQLGVAMDEDEAIAFRQAIFSPFISKGGIPISESFINSEAITLPTEIPAYIHVVTINKDTLIQGCENGILLKIRKNGFPHRDLLNPAALEECGIGYAVAGTTLAYSVMHQYGLPPSDWSAFFDLNRYPGKRALPIHPRGVLEAALLADGIRPNRVYEVLGTPEGIDRAFAKLDTIKDDIVWWDRADELQNLLMDGKVALAISQDGPLLMGEGKHNINIVRNQVIYKMLYFAIPKNADNDRLAYSFISFATQPNQQQALIKLIPYGSALRQSEALFSDDERRYQTNSPQNLENAVLENYTFYIKYGKNIEDRYNRWRKGNAPKLERVDVSSLPMNIDSNSDSKIEIEIINDESSEEIESTTDDDSKDFEESDLSEKAQHDDTNIEENALDEGEKENELSKEIQK